MSENVKAATDEEVDRGRDAYALLLGTPHHDCAEDALAYIARIAAEVRARKAAERELELERDLCAVCGVESCRHAGAGHAFATRRERITALEAELAEAKARADEAEQEIEDEMQRRDRYHDAVTEAHVALGGDGEWRAHVGGSPEPPHSGCLNLDVPVMARQLRERITALEAELAEAKRRLALASALVEGKHELYEQVKNTLEQVENEWRAAERLLRRGG